MHKQRRNFGHRPLKRSRSNLLGGAWQIAETAAEALAKWMTTDHTGVIRSVTQLQSVSLFEFVGLFVLSLVRAVLLSFLIVVSYMVWLYLLFHVIIWLVRY